MPLDNLILQHQTNKAFFMELFNISERTYQRWNLRPPAHVSRLFTLAMRSQPDRPDHWQHWRFDRDFLVDPDNNYYHIKEVTNIFWNRQLINELTGTRTHIISLKQQLEKQLKAQRPRVNISLTNDHETIKTFELQL